MLNLSSPPWRQGCQWATVSTAWPSGTKKRPSRRDVPQARQVQRGISPWRQRTPLVRQRQIRQRPGAVPNSQPQAQHTHLVAAPAASCTRAPSVRRWQTRQWTYCQSVTRQSMKRLWPQRTHSQIMTGFSRLGMRRHVVRWPHGSQWACWGLRYGSSIWGPCRRRDSAPWNERRLIKPPLPNPHPRRGEGIRGEPFPAESCFTPSPLAGEEPAPDPVSSTGQALIRGRGEGESLGVQVVLIRKCSNPAYDQGGCA